MGSPLSVGFYRVFFLSVDRLVLPIDDSFGALLGVKRFYQSEVQMHRWPRGDSRLISPPLPQAAILEIDSCFPQLFAF